MPREGSSPAVGTLSPLLLHKRGQAEGSRRLIPVTPPPAAFCCRRGPRDAPGAGGAPAAPVVLGGVPRAALRTRGGIGVEGGEVKTAASSRGGPGAPLGSGGGARSLRAAAALPRGGAKGEEEAAAGQGSSHGECLPAPPPQGEDRGGETAERRKTAPKYPGGGAARGEPACRARTANIGRICDGGDPKKILAGLGEALLPSPGGFGRWGPVPGSPAG